MKRIPPAYLEKPGARDRFIAPKRPGATPSGRRSGVSTHLAWAGGGFLLGAICWHMVGFWSFIDRVLDETQGTSRFIMAADVAPKASSITLKDTARLISAVSSEDCVQRVSTATRGETTVRPCALPVVAMRQHQISQ